MTRLVPTSLLALALTSTLAAPAAMADGSSRSITIDTADLSHHVTKLDIKASLSGFTRSTDLNDAVVWVEVENVKLNEWATASFAPGDFDHATTRYMTVDGAKLDKKWETLSLKLSLSDFTDTNDPNDIVITVGFEDPKLNESATASTTPTKM